MGDFIKELNIIDFLGIMLPGSLLILLLSMDDTSMTSIYTGYFGESCSEGIKITLLLIGGYLIGMLVHELGDQIEKQLWKIRCVDPKTYAAKVVGVDSIYKKLIKRDRSRVDTIADEHSERHRSRKDYVIGRYNIKLLVNKYTIKALIGLFLFSIIISWLLVFIYFKINLSELQRWILPPIIVLIIVLLVMIVIDFICRDEKREKIDYIRELNPAIQSRLVNKGNYQKRQVFDGFHVTMRNLLIVISVAEFYAYFFSDAESKLYELFQKFSEYSLVVLVIFALMFIRYYHYSYLKYKYSFENYLSLKQIRTRNSQRAAGY